MLSLYYYLKEMGILEENCIDVFKGIYMENKVLFAVSIATELYGEGGNKCRKIIVENAKKDQKPPKIAQICANMCQD